jgi:NHL repeat
MNASKTIRRIALTGLSVLGLLGAQLALAAGPAAAFTGYSTPTFFGAAGSGSGQFKEPAGVAVNNASKEVYVYDSGNLRVQRFDSTGGKFEGQFNGTGALTGPFTAPASISEHAAHGTLFNLAVDNDPSSPSVGDVYVVDPGHNVIDKFTAAGAYLSQLTGFKATVFGVAVDVTGDVWVEEEGSEVPENHGAFQEFDSAVANTHVTEVVAEKLRSPGIALDSEQNLYVLKGEPEVVKFSKTGSFLAELPGCCGTALAINAANNELLVDQNNEGTTTIARYAPFGSSFEETIPGIAASYGVAVNGASTTRDLYATQREANTVAIFKFGVLPDVTTGAASEVHRTTVKLAGEVNPLGKEVTSCRFEYGPTETYGQSVPCSTAPGSGTTPVAVSAEAASLTPQTSYHFRLMAGNTTGAHPGADQTFETSPAVENVLTEAALAVTATAATLPGSFEPNGFPTSYRFEYRSLTGTPPVFTPLQNAGSASKDEHVSAEVTGLTPNALYLFRVEPENQFGQTLGGFRFFKTPVIAPVIPGIPSASFIAAQSAVLNAKLNPEHTTTHYHFEYGACPTVAGCATVQSTADETSAVYGETGASQEVVGLAPGRAYAYRLIAVNEFEEAGETKHETTTGAEGTFTTAAARVPSLQTGGNTVLSATSAVIAGSVEPNGVPTTYSFELGIYNGAGTQYGVIAGGSAGSAEGPVPVSASLTGLQPGTTYAYRLSISSGYLLNETHTLQGATGTFTTPGLPSVLSSPASLPMLATPSIAFPTETKGSTTTTKALTRKQKLAKALKACKRDKQKPKRATCEAKAHKQYGAVKKAKK